MSFLAKKMHEREMFIDKQASSPIEHKEQLEELFALASAMNAVGVESEQDYKDFFYISTHVGEIYKNIAKTGISEEQLAKISHAIYINRDDYPINTIINFHKAVKNAMDKSAIPITKKAYPQGYESGYVPSPHNMKKWVQTMREIYALNTQGKGLGQAFDIATKKWDNMEKSDFQHWLTFYQSGQHLAYKTAQDGGRRYFEVGTAMIPLPKATIKGMPGVVSHDGDKNNVTSVVTEISSERAKALALYDRAKQLIGRLNAAERLFTKDVDFRKMLGNQFEPWLAKLHELKRLIQTTPIDSGRMSYATIQDMIIKSSNQLRAEGFDKSANLMRKLAQAPPPPPAMNLLETPDEAPPLLGDVAEQGSQKTDPDGAMEEFLSNLGAEDPRDEEAKQVETAKEKKAEIKDGAIIVVSEDDELKVQAQMTPGPADPVIPEETAKEDSTAKSDVDAVDSAIDNALENVTMDDLIAKLEGSASLYKQRPLARDLSMADLYMQALGIAPYFPEMAEATKSALDSNQYVLTRVEDILAKLRGASAGATIEEVKSKLEQRQDNKEKRKEQREAERMAPETPIEGPAPGEAPEMAAPATVERQPEGVRVR